MPIPEKPKLKVEPKLKSDKLLPKTGISSDSIESPELETITAKPGRALRTVAQAKAICLRMEESSRERNLKNARITAKYGAEQPFSSKKLKDDNQAWRSNFSTKPLPVLVDRVVPRFSQALDAPRYLTNAELPDGPGNNEKTELFREEITKLIRNKTEWRSLKDSIAHENTLFGYCMVGWLDEYSWWPSFYRQDQGFCLTNTKQTPDSAQVLVLKETFMPHELFKMVSDRKAATDRGWRLDNVVEAINTAMPHSRTAESNPARVYEDLERECCLGASMEDGAKVIPVYHLLVTEIDGQVSHYIFTSDSFIELFGQTDQFPSMNDAAAFFSFQHGNGTMHGSKGIGREVYNIAGVVDRQRNELVDKMWLSGKMMVTADESNLKRFQMQILGSTILIGQDYAIKKVEIDPQVGPSIEMDRFLTSILDTIGGAVTAQKFSSGTTRAEINYVAGQEGEQKDNLMVRFMQQACDMLTVMQRRACRADSTDPIAIEMQKRLLVVMTRKELDNLANQRVAGTIAELSDQERQVIIQVARESVGNPMFNSREMLQRKLTAQMDSRFAESVMLPENDPTEQAEQVRGQQLELMLIAGQSTDVPVSARDNHQIHLGVLGEALKQASKVAAQDPAAMVPLEAMLGHAEAHIGLALEAGQKGDWLDGAIKMAKALRAGVEQIKQLPPDAPAVPAAPAAPAAPEVVVDTPPTN